MKAPRALGGLEKQTLLVTLYGKALDSRKPDSILRDTYADTVLRQIDLDPKQLKVPEGADVSLPIRAKHLDGWTREFISKNPTSMVLHLGCGLDSRVFRVNAPPSVVWFDVDQAEVIELRRRLYPAREGCELVAANVTELEWLDRVPKDRPVLVVAEGLVMYLTEATGTALFRRITESFPSGELVFDAYSTIMVRIMDFVPTVRSAKVRLTWGIGDPRKLEQSVPRLRLADAVPFLTLPELTAHLAKSPARALVMRLLGRTKLMQHAVRHLRYQF